ncbi:unnamed protein product [Trichobilharzia regenti]|nr:unnamed protein product [Trichobilharzia regenti]
MISIALFWNKSRFLNFLLFQTNSCCFSALASSSPSITGSTSELKSSNTGKTSIKKGKPSESKTSDTRSYHTYDSSTKRFSASANGKKKKNKKKTNKSSDSELDYHPLPVFVQQAAAAKCLQ